MTRHHTPSQLCIVLAAGLLLVLESSCRTSISYEPRALASSAEAIDVIRQTLEAQHAQYAPTKVEVSETELSILRNESSHLLLTSGVRRTVIRFSTIAEVSLSNKRRWFAVTLARLNGEPFLHVYTPDALSAQRFMDAIETLQRDASPR